MSTTLILLSRFCSRYHSDAFLSEMKTFCLNSNCACPCICVFMQLRPPRLCQWGGFSQNALWGRGIFPLIGGQQWARRSGRSFNLYKNLHPSCPSQRREIKCFFTLVMSAQNDYLFWIIYSSARRNFLISPLFFASFAREETANGC